MQKILNRIFSLLLTVVMLAGMLPTTVWAAEGEITQVELTFDAPAIGDTLDFTLDVPASANYEVTSVKWLKDWSEYGNMLCDVYHRVEPGEPYTVRIYINPKEGYSFADPEDITVTVNGSADGVTFTHDDLDTGLVCSVAFDKLGYNVSFDANGGTGTMETVTNVYPDYLLPDCGFTAPEGMVFNGWTVDSPSGAWYAAGSTMDVNADITLYAKWADPTGTHKITFVNRAYDPSPTVEIIVSEGMYALPQIESIFEIPSGSTFDEWGVFIEGRWQYFAPNDEISVTEDLEIITIWEPIEYEHISKAVFELKLNHGVEYKHGMLAGSLSVSLGEVTGTFNEGAPQPISLATGGYGHGYWIVSGDMLQGTDSLSTKGGYRLYVKFDIPDDRHVLFHPDGFSLSGDLGNITAWNIVSLDGALVAVFKLPAVPGTPLTADAVTFTLDGYAIDQTIPAVTVGSSTPNVSLRGSGYGIDNAYMIYEDYVDADKKVTDPRAKFEKHQDYCLQIDYVLDEGYSFPDSFWDGSYLKKDKFKLAGFEDAVVTAVTATSVSFRLPQLGTTAVESLSIILNGYEAGKTAWDVSLTAPECMNLPELDNPTYPPYGRLYCYYDPVYGFGDSADGDCNPIASGTVLKVGDQYPFTIKFYPVDGYNYSELKKENITLVTPYGTCTATRFRPGFSENSYWLTFDLPAIGAVATTPITSVTISDLTKPVIGEMPDNDITVSGTGVTVDVDGSYWGRFVSPSFSPVYDDDTAVDSVVFREGETYMFQLYLNAAAGYEFTADSKFYFASDLLPAPDMTDLSKSFAMVNPSDSTQAVIYINMNDIAHIHVPGDWDFNDTHHWRKCTASGCDAGADVSRLPDYAEHSFVNGLCTCGAHKHSWSADWSVNETHHWHECSANGCTVTDNSGKDGYAAHDFTAGACVCGVENVITSIEISGITAPVAGETPINSASVDKFGAEVDKENTFWVRYDVSTGRTSDTYADGTSVHDTPFRDREIYLLQITIKPKTGYSFTADTKLLYGGTELSAPDAANPTASCGAIAPDCSMAMALINPTGASAPLTYTVSFVANGGTGTMADVTVESGAEYTLPANGFTAPAGKQFKAWNVGGSEKAVGDKITVSANTTVTAVWEDIPVTTYTVSFDANGGTGTMTATTVESGAEYTLPANGFTAPTGEQFKAWSVNGVEKAVGEKITVTANTTVTAV
ncbi:MAG: InlB B-repeat-containing protein, partial [Clostridia bacterium]|nr:InlB B-repeat-containing protein [Clostridia bacterium]